MFVLFFVLWWRRIWHEAHLTPWFDERKIFHLIVVIVYGGLDLLGLLGLAVPGSDQLLEWFALPEDLLQVQVLQGLRQALGPGQ